MSEGGWVLLGERPEEEIAIGLVGKFCRPVIEYADVDSTSFKDFAEPGFAKTVYALGTRPLEARRTLLWATMRTATADERRASGLAATGPSVSAMAPTCWPTGCWISSARRPSTRRLVLAETPASWRRLTGRR